MVFKKGFLGKSNGIPYIRSKEILISDMVENNYVIYHLSIKNNDTNTLNFSMIGLQLHARNQAFTPENQVFTPANPGIIIPLSSWVISEIEEENRLNDTLLYPDQTLEGIVIFQVDNYTTLFDRSFSLKYNTTPIPSTSFEKSLGALTVAEQFDYSIAFDTPPYDIHGGNRSYYPIPVDYYGRANWVNRTVIEYYNRFTERSIPEQKQKLEIAYAVKVIPEKDVTVFHTSEGKYKSTKLYVVDNNGEEMFNRSIFYPDEVAILDYQTYRPFSENMPQMFIPQATIVHLSYYSRYGWPQSMLFTYNNQDIILDEQRNITLARYNDFKAHSM
ncbi:MAG: hypothetical protein MIO93_13260 [ANME-2 cluster archaeon]|nr:hypothetical protein [ANME-2 cluster archaeon]